MGKTADDRVLLAAMAEQLPGWRIVTGQPDGAVKRGFAPSRQGRRNAGPASGAAAGSADPAPSIANLRRMFLGDGATEVAGRAYRSVDDDVVTVQVEPIEGGQTKTADFRDGRIVIVQG